MRGVPRADETRPKWRGKGAIIGLALAILCPQKLMAQEGDVQETIAEARGISRERVEARITEIDAMGGEADEARTRLRNLYRQILDRLDVAAKNEERRDSYHRAVEQAPKDTAKIRERLSAQESTPPPESDLRESDSLEDFQAYLEQVQAILVQTQADLVSARQRRTDLDRRIADEQLRPAQVRTLSVEAKTFLVTLEAELAAPEPSIDSAESVQADRWFLEARHKARQSELQMFDQELLSHSVRLDLLEAQREEADSQLSRFTSQATALESNISELRQIVAEKARVEAERLRAEALGKHQLIRTAASENIDVAREVEVVGPEIDLTRALRADVESLLAQSRADHDEIKQSIELVGSKSLGAVLLEQKHLLPDLRALTTRNTARKETIGAIRLRLYRAQRAFKGLSDIDLAVDGMIANADSSDFQGPVTEEIVAELKRLKTVKRENLSRLTRGLRDHLGELGDLSGNEDELIDEVRLLSEILDERLLWIRNADPVDFGVVSALPPQIRSLASGDSWRKVSVALKSDAKNSPVSYALAFFVILGSIIGRRSIPKKLEGFASKIGRVREDAITRTARALVCHTIWILPVPCSVLFVGYRLTDVAGVSSFTGGVGRGFVAAGITVLVFQFLRAILVPNGAALAHFGWHPGVCRILSRQLAWLLPIVGIAVFVISTVEWGFGTLYRNGVGRIAFVLLMLSVAFFLFTVLRAENKTVLRWVKRIPSRLVRRFMPVWVVFIIAVPVILGALAFAGYAYGAFELARRMNLTVILILAALLIHAFFYRWLVISQRRLALKIAMEKRAAIAKSRESNEDDAESEGLVDLYERIDVADLKEQTQDLLRVSIVIMFVVGLWLIWAGVFPALRVFDDVELWHHTVILDGKEVLQPITLASLGLALLIVIGTATAARKMPAFLEIAVLQKLPIDHGFRHAVRTLFLYLIVGVGIVLAFNVVGVGWSSVQWLVAALTVGLGFGLQEIFANFVSGLILLIERPIRVGDTVTVGAVSGIVTKIRMRATTITDWSRKELVVPNKNFITGELINWSLSDNILRMDFSVGIAYGSDTRLAHEVMLRVCREHPGVLDHPESNVFFLGFGDNSLDFRVRVFVAESTNTGRSRVLHDLHMAIDATCREHNINIAFPQRDLHLKTADAVIQVRHVGHPNEGSSLPPRLDGPDPLDSSKA